MRLLYVRLPQDQRDALLRLAAENFRRPADEAAYLLSRALRDAGALRDGEHTEPREPAVAGARP